MKNFMFAVFAVMVMGCSSFAGPPREEQPMMSDAGMTPTTDGGHTHPTDSGAIEMPREIDGGVTAAQPRSGEECDPDRDLNHEPYPCALDGCTSAELFCSRAGVWRCGVDSFSRCTPPTSDAGTDAGPVTVDAGSPAVDAGHDAGAIAVTDAGCDMGTDAGPPPVVDAGPRDFCVAGSFVGCWLSCGYPGHIDCNVANGRYDSACFPFEGLECPAPRDAGTDAGPRDAGSDAGRDLGTDAGPPPVVDAGTDAGSTWTPTDVLHMCLDISSLGRLGVLCPTVGTVPDIRLFLTDGSALSSNRASCIDVPMSRIGLGPWNVTVWCQPGTDYGAWADGGYFSPRVIAMPLNTAVSSSDFTDISINGRPARANTFYCWDTGGDRTTVNKRRVQVQVVAADRPLPTSCASGTGS